MRDRQLALSLAHAVALAQGYSISDTCILAEEYLAWLTKEAKPEPTKYEYYKAISLRGFYFYRWNATEELLNLMDDDGRWVSSLHDNLNDLASGHTTVHRIRESDLPAKAQR